MVSDSVRKTAFGYLIEKKNTQSKIRHINYKHLEMQLYLKSSKTTTHMAKFHFAARSSMINVRGNFKNQFGPEGNFCQGCLDKNQIESQMHIYQCISLSSSELVESHASHRYDDLFSEDIEKQLTVSKILKKVDGNSR